MATGLHYRKGQTDADHVIALSLYKKGLYAEALELFGKALSNYKKLGDTSGMPRTYMDIAVLMRKGIGSQTKINSYMQKAIGIGKRLETAFCTPFPDISPKCPGFLLLKSNT